MANTVGFEHDGTNCTIKSNDIPVLQTPFLEQTNVPTFLLGRDATSALPFYFDINTAIPIMPSTGPTPVPATPTTCVQVRCGVAEAMTAHLNSQYEVWSNWLGAIIDSLAAIGVSAVLAAMATPPGWIVDAIGGLAVLNVLKQFIAGFSGNINNIVLPYYSADIINALQLDLFCVLTCANNVCVPTAAQMTAWAQAIGTTVPPGMVNLAQLLTQAIIIDTSLSEWLNVASTSQPSSFCDTHVCS